MARFHNVDSRHRHALFGPPSRCLELGISVDGGDLALAIGGSVCPGRIPPGCHSAAGDGYRQKAMAALHRDTVVLSALDTLFAVSGDPRGSGLSLLSRDAAGCVLGRSVDIVSAPNSLKYSIAIYCICWIRGVFLSRIQSGVFQFWEELGLKCKYLYLFIKI